MADEARVYSITGQRQVRDFDAAGNVIDGVEVTWSAAGNIHGRTFVPLDQFTAEYVDSQIKRRLQSHYGVSGLGES